MKRTALVILLICMLGSMARAFGGDSNRNWRLRAVSMYRVRELGDVRDSSMITLEYFDGFGRPVQTQNFVAGRHGYYHAVADLTEYDSRGRSVEKWLPASVEAWTFADATVLMDRYKEGDASRTSIRYEATPQGRPEQTVRPGRTLRVSGKAIHTTYRFNGSKAETDYRCPELRLSGSLIYREGYYSPGVLNVTATEDEDGEKEIVFTDSKGKEVLRRRIFASTGRRADTMRVYDLAGRLLYILPPPVMALIEGGTVMDLSKEEYAGECYIFGYDGMNRVRSSRVPGGGEVLTAYTRSGQIALQQDAAMRAKGNVLRTVYDSQDRKVYTSLHKAQAGCFSDTTGGFTQKTVFIGAGAASRAGYSGSGASGTETILSADYYDTYDFLNVFPQYKDSLAFREIPGTDKRGDRAGSNFRPRGHLTGKARRVITSSGAGPWMVTAYYYDNKGRLIQSVETNIAGGYDVAAYALSHDGRITARTDIHSSADTVVRRDRQYGFATNGQVAFVRSRFVGRPWTELQNLSYDSMGRLENMQMINHNVGVEYDYTDDGSLLSINSDPFVQTIYRADCPGLPTDKKAFLNGRTTAEQFILRNSKEGKTGETLSYRYDYSYEGNMLTHAAHTELTRSQAVTGGLSLNAEVYENPDYSEQVSYGLDGRPQHIMRHGLKNKEVKSNTPTIGQTTTYSYGIVDEITLEYEGVRLKKANDNGEDSQLSGATDFAEDISRSVEYEYDEDGRLTRDWNKTSNIAYNVLGLPATVTRGTACIHYTYDSDGRLLKIEKGTNKLVSVIPDNPNGAIVSHIEFECSEVDKRCGDVEYVDGKIERIHNEAGWTDGKGQYVAAIRDARGSLRATWTKQEVPTAPGTVNVQLMHYDNLTAYYPYGLPWADRQGGSRDQYEGKELERFAGLLIYDFHARRYDPQLCLFQGPDPFATAYPSLHPYLYCAANPISFTDPTGCVINNIISEENKPRFNTIIEESKSNPIFAAYYGYMESHEETITFAEGKMQNYGGGSHPAHYEPSTKTIYFDLDGNDNNDDQIDLLAIYEDMYHGYQDLKGTLQDNSNNSEYEAKLISGRVAFDMSSNPVFQEKGWYTSPPFFVPFMQKVVIDEECLTKKNVFTPAFEMEYLQGGNDFLKEQYRLSKENGIPIPHGYDWPVTKVPQSLLDLFK